MAVKTIRNRNWSSQEIKCLLCIWAENYEDLIQTYRNRRVYERMAEQLQELGFTRSHSEVSMKIKNLTNDYKSEKKSKGETGVGSLWPYYDDVDKIIGSSHHSAPPLSQEMRLEQNAVGWNKYKVIITAHKGNEIRVTRVSTDEEEASNSPSLISMNQDEDNRRAVKRRKTSNEKRAVVEQMLKQMEETNQEMISLMERRNQLLEKILEKL